MPNSVAIGSRIKKRQIKGEKNALDRTTKTSKDDDDDTKMKGKLANKSSYTSILRPQSVSS